MTEQELYQKWLKDATEDPDLTAELKSIEGKADEIQDRFFQELEFGTGGLRGVIGAGTNRMNIYTVRKATQGLANYLNGVKSGNSVAISFDSRIKSERFAREAAGVMAANGITAYIYPELMPTPALSFAVRRLGCDAGIMVTASHNPAKYNGYKAYGPDGCQLNLEASEVVIEEAAKVDCFEDVKKSDYEAGLKDGSIKLIEQWLIEEFLDNVQAQQVNPQIFSEVDLKIIYTPLNGTGNKPVRAILDRIGVKNVTVVPEQELPDGNFPTAPFPNPEIREAFNCALKLAETVNPDLLLATDPDCDRVGIAVAHKGEFKLMSGNEVGALLANYVLSQKSKQGRLPENPIVVKTIVSTGMVDKIAAKYGATLINVLTGFKFIGEQILLLEKKGEENRYQFGFEESYGYLSGTYVRDKDAVVGSMLICEMAAFYKKQGKTLIDAMNELYAEFGLYKHTQCSFVCEGVTGMQRMNDIMDSIRNDPPKQVAGRTVEVFCDYKTSVMHNNITGAESRIDLPSSNVLEFRLEGDASFIIRPSGTEPKIKVYLNAVGESQAQCDATEEEIKAAVTDIMGF